MTIRLSGNTARDLHGLFQHGSLGTYTDGQLLTRFLSDDEGREAAFRALVVRHGPMVLGVCRRILEDPHSADDAFQATFLVLVRKASTLRDRDLLTSWLHGVAQRTARKARAASARRRAVEGQLAETPNRQGDFDQAELRAVIDEEIGRLPERFRVPLVLCHLEGLRHQEVARRLGCPVGTVESRLSRAREQLRSRLARRGLAPTAGLLAGVCFPFEAPAAVVPLIGPTVRSAVLAASAELGSKAAVLTWLKASLVFKALKSAGAGLAASLVISAGAAVVGVELYRVDRTRVTRSDRAPIRTNDVAVIGRQPGSPPPPADPRRRADISPRRVPSATAVPLQGIVIDGDLGDWPRGLTRYRIRNRLETVAGYDPGTPEERRDFDASFMAGFNPQAGLIYLAVVVRDPDVVLSNEEVGRTDAAEIYIDGLFSDRSMPVPSTGWKESVFASAMPAMQYVGMLGSGPAYADPAGANPALMYGAIAKTSTTMRTHHDGEFTTYEWAVQAFDRYPDRPTRLEPGKSLGLEVAIVDRDRDRKHPAFTTWGIPQTIFKGFDAGQLGELKLVAGP